LDLPDTLAGDGELFADFLQRVVGLLADAEAHAQDLLLARRERGEHLARLLAEIALNRSLDRRRRELVLDKIAERTFLLVADGRFERDRLLDDLEHLLDLVQRHLHLLRDFFGPGFAAEPLHEQARDPEQFVDRLDHVDRDANGAALVSSFFARRLLSCPAAIVSSLRAYSSPVFLAFFSTSRIVFCARRILAAISSRFSRTSFIFRTWRRSSASAASLSR